MDSSLPPDILALVQRFSLSDEARKQLARPGGQAALFASLRGVCAAAATAAAAAPAAPPSPDAAAKLGTMLFSVAAGLAGDERSGAALAQRRELLAAWVASGRLATAPQVAAAVAFCKAPARAAADDAAFVAELERACGADVVVSEAQIAARAKEVVARHAAQLREERYLFVMGALMQAFKQQKGEGACAGVAAGSSAGGAGAVSGGAGVGAGAGAGDESAHWQWADGKLVKAAVDAEVLALLGPRGAADETREAEIKAARRAAEKAAAAEKKRSAGSGAPSAAEAPPAVSASAPVPPPSSSSSSTAFDAGSFDARFLQSAVNSPELIAAHERATGRVLRTRFPPEPNGYLHIGHAKSMNLNFEGFFREYRGAEGRAHETIFRYDDTNPDAESVEYIENQAENVAWMGWRPARVTHSSDYFGQLHDLAVKLIRDSKAYVCHQSKAEIEASREAAAALHRPPPPPGASPSLSPAPAAPESPWRDRPAHESLREFALMRAGFFAEGTACLRLRIDMRSVNPNLWDPVAYRVKYTPHPHAGDAWCIYPTYDYSHAVIDSLEEIDFSLCTLEFEGRRDQYYWVLEALGIWRPHVWEFARLEITHVQLSKRKILKLVTEGRVRGWDDPRIPTINGLRRRGYTPEAINAFCRDIGVTRHHNQVDYRKLEHHVRLHLDAVARRDFVVLDPLRIELVNVDARSFCLALEAPDFPRDAALGSHALSLTATVYVERDDFREVDDPSFYGLAPGKWVGLRYAGYVKVVGVERAADGSVALLRAEYDHARSKAAGKVKGNLHWVSGARPGEAPPAVQVRLYEHLFTTESPGSTGDWEAEINAASERVLDGALASPSLAQRAQPGERYQFERVGFFVCDKDSRSPDKAGGKVVFNQTVGLKESADLKSLQGQKGR